MDVRLFTIIGILALAFAVSPAYAQHDESYNEREPKGKATKDKAGKQHKKGKEWAESRGEKRGWKGGRPPGQTKQYGEHVEDESDHGPAGSDRHKHRDRDHEKDEQHAGADSAEKGAGEQAVSDEQILRDIAKDEASRRSGAAPGSPMDELIRIGTDRAIDRAKGDDESH